MFTRKKHDKKGYSPYRLKKERRKFIKKAEEDFKKKFPGWPNQLPQQSGLFQTEIPEPGLDFVEAPGASESDIQIMRPGKQNCWIVMGRDRPSTLASGYGRTSQRTNAIDLVVGRMSAARGGEGPKDGSVVNPSFALDAARIYISQLTDIDKNFGLAHGKIGSSKERSGVGIKADGIRIIGREGVKIVTGASDHKGGDINSLGGKIRPIAPGIELIAGNNTGSTKRWKGIRGGGGFEFIPNLQPLLRGFNTRDSLREFSRIMDKMWAGLWNMMLIQGWFNKTVATNIWGAHWPHAFAGLWSAALNPVFVGDLMYSVRNEKMEWEVNYLEPFGYKYICSRNVRST